MPRKFALFTLCTAALLAAGCDRGATEPQAATLSSSDVEVLADGLDQVGWSVLGGGLGSFGFGPGFSLSGTEPARASSAPVPINVSYTRTAQCPKGGSVTVVAKVTGESDPATRSLTTTTTATKTENACAFEGRNAVVITVNGDPNVVLTSNQKVVNGAPSGPQTSTQKGGFRWSTSAGKSGTCKVDIASTVDPAAKTRTVTGTMCGKTINVTRPLGGTR